MKPLMRLLKEAFGAWQEDYAASMGAALSYYTMFSIAPLLLIVIAVAGLVFGEEAARGALVAQLQGLVGSEGARAIEAMIASVDHPKQGIIATVTGIVTLLVGATTVFAELQSDLDRIWRAPARKEASGIWALLRTRLLSFGMILGIAFLLMVSLVVSAAVSALGSWWAPFFGAWEATAHAINALVGFGVTTVLFALIYKIMPRANVSWHDVWIGSAFTALLFTIGRVLIGLYLGKSGVASGYGAAGSLVLVMLWVYYSAQIFLLGAEFTWVYAHESGSRRGRVRPRAGVEAKIADAEEQKEPAPRTASAEPAQPAGAMIEVRPGRRPLAAMAFAAGAGMAVALLTRGRRHGTSRA